MLNGIIFALTFLLNRWLGGERVMIVKLLTVFFMFLLRLSMADMPKQYGSFVTSWRRLKRWSERVFGIGYLIFSKIIFMRMGQLPLGIVAIDSSFVEAKKGRKCRV